MNLHDAPLMTDEAWPAEAENAVIGALLMTGQEAYDIVGGLLTADSFFSGTARRVFAAVETMVIANKPVDMIAVLEELKRSGAPDIDIEALHAFTLGYVGKSVIKTHAQIVSEGALERSLRLAATEVRVIASDASTPVFERIASAQSRLEQVQKKTVKSEPQHIEAFVVDLIDRLQSVADGSVEPGIQTQIPTLDQMLGGGLKPGKQIIIAARPSVGKSSLAQQICINVARQGYAAALLSMEMTCQELTDRAVANLGRIGLDCFSDPRKMRDEDWGRMVEAVETFRSFPLFFDEQPALSLADITAKARALKRKHDLKLLAIDYLQLCASGKTDSRHHQIEEISRGLKTLAKQLGITILTLSQLNREVEKRTGGRPMLSDLKESGAIEEDADVVLMMWRHRVFEGSSVIGLGVPKNRQGRTGEVALHFEGAYQRWAESTESLTVQDKPMKGSRYAEDF